MIQIFVLCLWFLHDLPNTYIFFWQKWQKYSKGVKVLIKITTCEDDFIAGAIRSQKKKRSFLVGAKKEIVLITINVRTNNRVVLFG